MIPAFNMSSTFSVAAFKPKFSPFSRISLTMTEPSRPALWTICRIGSSSARFTM